MQNEQKKRLEKFKRVSGRLLWFTMPMLIFFSLGGSIAWLVSIFRPLGDFGIAEVMASIHDGEIFRIVFTEKLTISAKVFWVVYGATTIASMTYVLFHFHSLLECFFDGHVFKAKALSHARKAYSMNLWSLYFQLSVEVIAIIVTAWTIRQGVALQVGNLIDSILINLIIIGFLSLLLWALEMGTDLNEDAELTI